MTRHTLLVDVVIFGGGVAGLWLLARLRRLGYQAVLLEAQALGAGQTRYAQGIIHGGTKYTLTGVLTGSSEAITEMPSLWRSCLMGQGELDLRQVKLLSTNQFIWSTDLTSRLASFFASKLMRSRISVVEGDERPTLFRTPAFHGQVYRLDEPVLDTASLIHALAEPQRGSIFRIDANVLHIDRDPTGWCVSSGDICLTARRLVFTAGKGNAELLARCGHRRPEMQLRPLRMVMVRGSHTAPLPGTLYAHCIGTRTNPRITITTHYDTVGHTVWYLGGQIAEEGAGRDHNSQIAAAQRELGELFPWLNLAGAGWESALIDRAEPRMPYGRRPDSPFVEENDGIITAWPTKLAFAPCLASMIVEKIRQEDPVGTTALPHWPHPGYAVLPWQEEERWS